MAQSEALGNGRGDDGSFELADGPLVNTMDDSDKLPAVKVTKTVVGLQSISFHVNKIGVPVLVKFLLPALACDRGDRTLSSESQSHGRYPDVEQRLHGLWKHAAAHGGQSHQ